MIKSLSAFTQAIVQQFAPAREEAAPRTDTYEQSLQRLDQLTQAHAAATQHQDSRIESLKKTVVNAGLALGLGAIPGFQSGTTAWLARDQVRIERLENSLGDERVRSALLRAHEQAPLGIIPDAVDRKDLVAHYPAIHDLLGVPLTPYDRVLPGILEQRQRRYQARYEDSRQGEGQGPRPVLDTSQDDRIVAELRGDPTHIKHDRVAWIQIGGGGSGKSTRARRLASEEGALLIDGDLVRSRLDVPRELAAEQKRRIKGRLLDEAVASGENIILSYVPTTTDRIAAVIDKLKQQNYQVKVELVSAPLDAIPGRMLKRGSDWYSPETLNRAAETVYHQLRTRGVGDEFRAFANDIPGGEPHAIADNDPLIQPPDLNRPRYADLRSYTQDLFPPLG